MSILTLSVYLAQSYSEVVFSRWDGSWDESSQDYGRCRLSNFLSTTINTFERQVHSKNNRLNSTVDLLFIKPEASYRLFFMPDQLVPSFLLCLLSSIFSFPGGERAFLLASSRSVCFFTFPSTCYLDAIHLQKIHLLLLALASSRSSSFW